MFHYLLSQYMYVRRAGYSVKYTKCDLYIVGEDACIQKENNNNVDKKKNV